MIFGVIEQEISSFLIAKYREFYDAIPGWDSCSTCTTIRELALFFVGDRNLGAQHSFPFMLTWRL